MSVRLEKQAIVLQGICSVDQVEALLAQLQAHPDLPVDIGAADLVHTALWQVMLMMKTKIVGTAPSKFTNDHILPALQENFLHPTSQ
ncbi:MAG: hypothetical protein ABWY49_03900 [Rhizobium sp.]